ncbi:Thioredoxin [Halobacillus karajensis]|uniref:Thioredoxin-like protein YdbP n=1 Tax=Halobacillus karajensis TaxID=195088 RepID=A0A024P8K0_9BACI|nr:thioredoxin family protein [Halobacillus karajensis]CDQ21530.1 Thioredoxin-like protein YdbP [Halobacillus karajensis]CDQ25464.1 Thioredoxin-like protein YdbP [Halobacillus karajensis]CDQ29005.1 Thioredoxin-like protein YdbP [Halobacillus karajensis]SEI09235.1 Thioredoxin [Halobacillus karajensis]
METIHTTDTFNKTIESDHPVIVKFEADWCPDCRRMDMFIGDILEEYNGYKWYNVNRDELPEIAEKYEVMGIPSILIFKDGNKQAHLHSANAKTPEEVQEFLQASL